jgi:hypothetical protein
VSGAVVPALGIAALGGRIALLGAERIVVKRLGASASGAAAAFLFFFIATVFLAPLPVLVFQARDAAWLAALLMIGCSLLMAVGRTVDTSQVRSVGSSVYAFAIYAAVTFWLGVFVIASGRAGDAVRLLRGRPLTAVAAGAVNAFSYLLLLVALGSLEVSVAEPASMLSLLVTLVLAGVVFRERIGPRFLPTLLMIAGAWLLLS